MRQKVVVVGAGTIGLSWTALFLAKDKDVTIFDVRPDLAETTFGRLDALRRSCAALGLFMDLGRLVISRDLPAALADADVVQESCPESLKVKRVVHREIADHSRPRALRLSSASHLSASSIAEGGVARPERLLVGHPFVPPHIVPLVEVIPGRATDGRAVDEAVEFYRSVGKRPVVLPETSGGGSPVNRLQRAILREAIRLATEDGLSVRDIDQAVCASIGPRLAAGGPFLSFHLNGGAGGIRGWLTNIGTSVTDPQTASQVADLVEGAYDLAALGELAARRDERQARVLRALQDTGEPTDVG